MSAYKDNKTGKWYVFFYYRDFTGKNKGKTKRGFETKREALDWERNFKQTQSGNLEMSFREFVSIYHEDIRPRLKHNTWLTKKNITDSKIMPYFAEQQINKIRPADIIKWQNIMLAYKDEKGNPFSPVYLKTLHNQVSAIFNHAVRFYSLTENPAQKAGNMCKEKGKDAKFWVKEEYLAFSDAIMDKPVSFYAFEVLYWTGIRIGELLALTPSDIDIEKETININKSYQRLEGKDYITSPKTEKSNRIIKIPDFLAEELNEYMNTLYKIKPNERIFEITKGYLHNEMTRGCKVSGVERIKLHSLRHSAISLLIELGFSAVAIAERMGHESIDITYRYAHMFPSKQDEMATKLSIERNDV
ncbi:MAG: site-specific integrase [Anaerorhabdus sp.]